MTPLPSGEAKKLAAAAMEVCDFQNPLSAPVFRKKRSQTKKRRKLFFEKPFKVVRKKPKQVRKVSSETVEKSERIKRKRVQAREIYPNAEAKLNILEKAEKVISSLVIVRPFFAKCMLPSNVSYSFWMILPKWFCNSHLPNQDATIYLVDEWEKEHKTTYLVDRHGLSGGWRGFSMSHALVKGDVLIFILTKPCRFKVHIVRVNDSEVVNAALCLMHMDATEPDLANQDKKKRKKVNKYADTTVLDAPTKQVEVEEKASQSETCSDSLCSEVVQGAKINDNLVSTGHHFLETAFGREPHRGGVTCM